MLAAAALSLVPLVGSLAQPAANQGGALLVHTNDTIQYTTSQSTYCALSTLECAPGGECDPDDSIPTTDHEVGEAAVFWVLAGFPPAAIPSIVGLTFGLEYSTDELSLLAWGACADFELATAAWPASGEGTAVTWHSPRHSHLLEVYWFAGYIYGPGVLGIALHPTQGAVFGDDAVPPALVPVDGFGRFGFGGTPGVNPHLPASDSMESDIYLADAARDLDTVPLSGAETGSISVTNLGTTGLDLFGVTTTGAPLTIVGFPPTISPGAIGEIQFLASPDQIGPFTASVEIRTNDPDEPTRTVLVTGTAVEPPVAQVEPTVIVRTLDSGTSETAIVAISNTGASDLEWSMEPGPEWIEPWPVSGTVPPGGSEDLTVYLLAQTLLAGEYAATLTLHTNDPGALQIEIEVALTVSGDPDLQTIPTALQFPDTYVGRTESLSLRLRNAGTRVLNVSGLDVDSPDFAVDTAQFSLEPTAHRDFEVHFSPESIGQKAALLLISSNDPDEPSLAVPLTGEGTVAGEMEVFPPSFDVVLVAGESTTDTLRLSNIGTGPLPWSIGLNVPGRRGLDGFRVLYDRSRGQQIVSDRTALVGELVRANTTVIASTDRVTPALLAGFDLFWSTELQSRWLDDECAALAAWIEEGGDLLLEGDENIGAFQQLLNAIGGGIELATQTGVSGTTDRIEPHPATAGVEHLFLPGPDALIVSMGERVQPLFEDLTGNRIGVAVQVGLGRVVLLTEDLFAQDAAWQADNLRFGVQLFAWCADNVDWFDVAPSSGVLAAGESVDVLATLDAALLIEGTQRVDVVVASDDVDTPEVLVPVSLFVLGEPRIEAEPVSLAFDTLFVGATFVDTVWVRNSGSAPLEVEEVSIAPGYFTAPPDGFVVQPFETHALLVTFAPLEDGVFEGHLELRSNDPHNETLVVPISGIAVHPPSVSVSPPVVRVELDVSEERDELLTLANRGLGPLHWRANVVYASQMRVAEESPSFGEAVRTPKPKPESETALLGEAEGSGAERAVSESLFRMTAPAEGASTPPDVGQTTVGQATVGQATVGQTTIEDIAARLRVIQAEQPGYFHDRVPGLWWLFELGDGPEVVDTGFDMYDGGNRISTDLGGPVLYTNGEIRSESAFGVTGRYFTIEIPGLFALVADLDEVNRFAIDGNLGADGEGVVDGATLTLRRFGRDYVGFVKRVVGTGDSPVYHLIITEFGSGLAHEFATDTNNDHDEVIGLAGSHRLFYLLATSHFLEPAISNEEWLTVMAAFLEAVDPFPTWLSVSPSRGVVAGAPNEGGLSSQTLRAHVDASGILDGRSEAQILLSSNDPDEPTLLVPVEVTAHGLAEITSSTPLVDFGDVFVGGTGVETLLVTNSGSADLQVDAITFSEDGFKCATPVFSVAPGGTSEIEFRVTPAELGESSAVATLHTNASGAPEFTIQLSVRGIAPPEARIAPASLSGSLVTGERETRSLVIENLGPHELEVSAVPWWTETATDVPSLVGFTVLYDRSNGQSESWNEDDELLTRLAARGAEIRDHPSGEVTEELLADVDLILSLGWHWATTPWTLDEVGVMTRYLFRGGALLVLGDLGRGMNEILLRSESGIALKPNTSEIMVSSDLEAHPITRGVDRVRLPNGEARFEISDPAISLVRAWDANDCRVAVSQVGAGRIFASSERRLFDPDDSRGADNLRLIDPAITWLLAPGAFEVLPGEWAVAPGTTTTLNVTFDASALEKDLSAVLKLRTNDPKVSTVTVPLDLRVLPSARVALKDKPIEFDSLPIGGAATVELEITNEGVIDLEVEPWIEGGSFSVEPALLVVPPNQHAFLMLRFAPEITGDHSGVLRISSNDPVRPKVDLLLAGRAVLAPIATVTGDSLDYALFSGDQVTGRLRIENTGDGELDWRVRVDGALGDLAGVRVLWQVAHGQPDYSSRNQVIHELAAAGANVYLTYQPLADLDLETFDVLWMADRTSSYSDADWSLLYTWLERGGALLVEDPSGDLESLRRLREIGCDVAYSPECYSTYGETFARPHPISDGNTLFLNDAYRSRGCLSVTGPGADPLFVDAFGQPVAVAGAVGFGRVVIFASRPFYYAYDTHLPLGVSTFRWLAASRWLSADDGLGIVPPGSSTEVELRIDARGIDDLTDSSVISVLSNDPAQGAHEVPLSVSVLGGPRAEFSLAEIPFGSVVVGDTVARRLYLRNSGTRPLVVSGYEPLPAGFSTDLVGATIQPEQELPFNVTCAPLTEGDIEAALILDSNDPNATARPLLLHATALVSPELSTSPDSLSGALPVGGNTMRSFTLTNHGTGEVRWVAQPEFVSGALRPLADLTGLRVLYDRSHRQQELVGAIRDQLVLRGADIRSDATGITPETLTGVDVLWVAAGSCDHCYPPPWTESELAAVAEWMFEGGSVFYVSGEQGPWNRFWEDLGLGIDVQDYPYSGPGPASEIADHPAVAGLDALVHGSNHRYVEVEAPGVGLVWDSEHKVTIAAASYGAGRLIVMPYGSYYFSHVPLLFDRTFDWLGHRDWIHLSAHSGVLHPGEQADISVTLDALHLFGIPYRDQIVITSGDAAHTEVRVPVALEVAGTPRLDLSAEAVAFGAIPRGGTATRFLVVGNTGDAFLSVSGSTDPSEYSIDGLPVELRPGDTAEVALRFAPSLEEFVAGALHLVTNDPEALDVTIPLTGEGVPPAAISVSPDSVAFDMVPGGERTTTVTLSNTGTGLLEWDASLIAFPSIARRTAEANEQDLLGVRILWTRRVYQPSSEVESILMSDLEARGATRVENEEPLTSELLSEFDVLWWNGGTNYLPDAEVEALRTWLEQGGGLFLDEWAPSPDRHHQRNDLLRDLGLSTRVDWYEGHAGATDHVHRHPTTIEVERIDTPLFVRTLLLPRPNWSLVDDRDGRPLVAAVPMERGRIAVIAEPFFIDERIDQADNRRLANQLVSWLRGDVISVDPASGVVPAGETADVDLRVDANGLSVDLEDLALRFVTNDPARQEVLVPFLVDLLPKPDIALHRSVLDFGAVPTGLSTSRSFEISNEGSEPLNIVSLTIDSPLFHAREAPTSVPAGERGTVWVDLLSDQIGSAAGSVLIESNDPDEPAVVLELRVDVVPPPILQVDPTPIEMTMPSGTFASTSFDITNVGATDLHWSLEVEFEVEPATRSSRGVSEPEPLADLTGVNILLDRARGQPDYNYSREIKSELILRGANVSQSSADLTPEELAGYDVLWSVDRTAPYSPAEEAAIVGWVRGGGSLLLEDAFQRVSWNRLLGELGIPVRFERISEEDTWWNPIVLTKVFDHPTTRNVESVAAYSALHLVGRGPTVRPLADDFDGHTYYAAATAGAGRLFLSTPGLWSGDLLGGGTQTDLFIQRAFDWLLGSAWARIDPALGVVHPNEQGSVSVTLDARDFVAGSYTAQLRLKTDDPASVETQVPISLIVRSAARVEADQESIVFEPTIVGSHSEQTLLLRNRGDVPLSISGLSIDEPGFEVSVGELYLGVGERRRVHVRFRPETPGAFAAQLLVHSNDPATPLMIPLQGEGLPAPDVVFPIGDLVVEVRPGEHAIAEFTLENHGPTPLEVDLRAEALEGIGREIECPRRPPRVALLDCPNDASELQNALVASGLFAEVTEVTFGRTIPSLETLRSFDVLLLAPLCPSVNRYALGNRLADYLDAGGSLVLTLMTYWDPYLAGRVVERLPFAHYGYHADEAVDERLGDHDASHPLLSGVTELRSILPAWDLDPRPDAEVQAYTTSGFPLVATRGDRLVALNLLLSDATLEFDAVRLVENSLLWASHTAPWVGIPSTGIEIEPNSAKDVALDIDASELAVGDYPSVVCVTTNDPVHPHGHVTLRIHVSDDEYSSDLPEAAVPATFAFPSPRPNPFTNECELRFDLPRAAFVQIGVFDAAGRQIRRLRSQDLPAGHHLALWDGRDDKGHDAPTGVYFARLSTSEYSRTRRVILAR